MKITQENADRLDELATTMQESLSEFKEICKESMSPSEWNNFRYNVLAHVEPGVGNDHEWFSPHTKTLTDIVELAREDATSEDDEEDGDEEDNNSKSEE